jgi:hypothetical protein
MAGLNPDEALVELQPRQVSIFIRLRFGHLTLFFKKFFCEKLTSFHPETFLPQY